MSSSAPETAIYTTDSLHVAEAKIMFAETKKVRLRPAYCPIFQYYFFLFEKDDRKLKKIEIECTKGDFECQECKAGLVKKVKNFLSDLATKREKAKTYIEPLLK
jgi:tryptophanyl-tRNA synthetase